MHQDYCYNCGSTENLTNDHIPPKGFFPTPRPSNLITVKCCAPCNNRFSRDDEEFRVWVSSARDCSKSGKWIWTNKVVPNSLDGNPKLREKMSKLLVTLTKETKAGKMLLPGLGYPKDRARRFLIRITKALIIHFYPHLHSELNRFKVLQITPETRWILRQLIPLMIHEQRGNEVFRFYRGIPVNAPQNSAWIYVFYEDAAFFVLQYRWSSRPIVY